MKSTTLINGNVILNGHTILTCDVTNSNERERILANEIDKLNRDNLFLKEAYTKLYEDYQNILKEAQKKYEKIN